MVIKEILLLETDYSCALCGNCVNDNLSIHHIDCDEKNNEYDNQILMCHNCHHRFHNNKGISVEDIKGRKKILMMKILTQ